MGSDDSGTSIGIHIGADDEGMLEKFDSRFVTAPGESRSNAIKRAMKMFLVVDRTLDTAPWEYPNEHERRHAVRQAILDMIEDEMEE